MKPSVVAIVKKQTPEEPDLINEDEIEEEGSGLV